MTLRARPTGAFSAFLCNVAGKRMVMVALTTSLLLVSCKKDETGPQEQAPIVPPQSSMRMNFEEFPDSSHSSSLSKGTSTYNNWGWAIFNVGVWNSVLTVTLAVPVAAYIESFNHTPTVQSDGSWLWTYTVEVGGVSYTAKLYGRTDNASVGWRMLISRQGGADVEWFVGSSNLAGTEGTWTFYDGNHNQYLFVEWHGTALSTPADLKFTNVVSGAPENGSFIFYGRTTSTSYNRFYTIFGHAANNETDIEWNFGTRVGRVKDPLHFSNVNWNCWDGTLMDSPCP